MIVVGLVGGIAAGKSTVMQQLSKLGAAVIDGDQVTRVLQRPGELGWAAIRQTFGPDYFLPNGELDRGKLGRLVFGDPEALKKLNAVMFPLITEYLERELTEVMARGTELAVVEGAALYESGLLEMMDEVWLVRADPEVRRKRLMARDGYSDAEARMRMNAQISETILEGIATRIIDSSDAAENSTWEQVQKCYRDAVAKGK